MDVFVVFCGEKHVGECHFLLNIICIIKAVICLLKINLGGKNDTGKIF